MPDMSSSASLLARRSARMTASEIRELLKILDRPGLISFAGGIPNPSLFDMNAFQQAYAKALGQSETGRSSLQYSTSEGHLPLRRWIAAHMAAKGVQCAPDNILVTCGSQQGLDFIGKLFLDPGDTVVTASPTYLGALQAFNAYEPRYDTFGGNVTAGLLRVNANAQGSRVKLLYLVPDFANPSGTTLDVVGRKRALDIANELGCFIVEDAAYTALRYDGDDLPPIATLDQRRSGSIEKSRTLYCGTFSKTLSPGLRIGWVCGPKHLLHRLTLAKQAADLHSATINQIAMHKVAVSSFDEQVAKARILYRERRDVMLEALARHAPEGMHWTRPEGGLFVWATLPGGIDGRRLLERAIAEENVAFVPGQAFFPDRSGMNHLRLSFSLPDPSMIDDGIARLCKVIKSGIPARQ
jgi:DNA-binding transcriptional MocR family regulator